MKEKIKKIGTIFLNIILYTVVFISIIFIFSFMQMKKNNKKYINIFGHSVMQVATHDALPISC